MDFIEKLRKEKNIILNSQQEMAVRTIDGATLLLAVPGSGKTTVIISRIGNMIYDVGIAPESILTLTFSVAAVEDMKKRFVSIFGREYEQRLKFKTIHSFSYMVIKEYEQVVNSSAFEVMTENSRLVRDIYIDIHKEFIGDEIIKDIVQKIGYCKNMMLAKEEIDAIHMPDCNFSQIYYAYEEYKKRNRLMDYDDMLSYAYTILRKYPHILEKYQEQFRYINVDEAQDTSYIQHRIIQLLAGKYNNIFMVGDEDQSIYGFRAAFPKALLEFKGTYKDAKVLLMERNYRSTKEIVNSANKFIKQNKDRYVKNMFSENEQGTQIRQTRLDDLRMQYEYIANMIENKKGGESIAVLYRNNDSAVALVDELEHRGIPFYIRENKPAFFSHFIVNDIRCFIRLSQNPMDINAFEKIYYKLNCGISRQMFEYVRQHLRGNVFDTLYKMYGLKESLRDRIPELKRDFEVLRSLKPQRAINFIESNLGYSFNISNLSNSGYAKETLLQKMNALKSIAAKKNSIAEFAQRLSELEEIMTNPSCENSKVTLSTIHSSKGLEFDKVILIDALDGHFPTWESIKQLDEGKRGLFEEEARLFYVGITRARKKLEIITSSFLNRQAIRQSRFISYLMFRPEEAQKIEEGRNGKKVKALKAVTEEELRQFKMNTRIIHKSFGEGSVINVSSKIIEVEFDNEMGKTKRLALEHCIQNGLIEKVK